MDVRNTIAIEIMKACLKKDMDGADDHPRGLRGFIEETGIGSYEIADHILANISTVQEAPKPKEKEPTKLHTCRATRQADQMYCPWCVLTWDINDTDPPVCPHT